MLMEDDIFPMQFESENMLLKHPILYNVIVAQPFAAFFKELES